MNFRVANNFNSWSGFHDACSCITISIGRIHHADGEGLDGVQAILFHSHSTAAAIARLAPARRFCSQLGAVRLGSATTAACGQQQYSHPRDVFFVS
jgi:hypothetical protein